LHGALLLNVQVQIAFQEVAARGIRFAEQHLGLYEIETRKGGVMTSDRIEKTTVLRAPRSRVWHALSNAKEFGRWFGINLDGEFAPHSRLEGKVTLPGYEHLHVEMMIERIEPEWLLSWRWHPSPIDAAKDYSKEPTTLVSLVLSDVMGGTKLTINESGFENIPATRREEAYKGNEKGWEMQIDSLTRYISSKAA